MKFGTKLLFFLLCVVILVVWISFFHYGDGSSRKPRIPVGLKEQFPEEGIDVVCHWVDYTKRNFLTSTTTHGGIDYTKFLLRSLTFHLPWAKRLIFLVSNDNAYAELASKLNFDSHIPVEIVNVRAHLENEMRTESEASINSLLSVLVRIDSISEKFVLVNDRSYFQKELDLSYFMSENGSYYIHYLDEHPSYEIGIQSSEPRVFAELNMPMPILDLCGPVMLYKGLLREITHNFALHYANISLLELFLVAVKSLAEQGKLSPFFRKSIPIQPIQLLKSQIGFSVGPVTRTNVSQYYHTFLANFESKNFFGHCLPQECMQLKFRPRDMLNQFLTTEWLPKSSSLERDSFEYSSYGLAVGLIYFIGMPFSLVIITLILEVKSKKR